MKKTLGIGILLLVSCSTLQSVKRTPQSVEELNSDQAVVEAVFKKFTTKLDRDLITFRYEDEARSHFLPQNIEDVKKREVPWSKRFYDSAVATGDDVGPGVFMSTDINGTAVWGGEDPQLFVLKIKKGSTIIAANVTHEPTAKDLLSVEKIIRKMSCTRAGDKSHIPIESLEDAIGIFRDSDIEDCRKFVIDIFRDLGIQNILYSFNSVPLKDCRVIGSAVDIIDPSSVNWEESNFYSKETKIEGDKKLPQYLKEFAKEGKYNPYTMNAYGNEADLEKYLKTFHFFDDVQSVASADYTSWKQSHIYGCGAYWSTEPRNSSNYEFLTQFTFSTSVDKELLALYLKTKFAYVKRFGDNSTSLFGRMNLLEKIGYKNSHMAADDSKFDQWKKAKDLQYEGFNNTVKAVAGILEEEYPFATDREQIDATENYFKRANSSGRTPTVEWYAIHQVGVGPRYVQLNSFDLLDEGRPPILVDRMPQSPSDTSVYNESAVIYKKVLENCLQIYNDPQNSNESITNGPCGLRPTPQPNE